MGTGKSGRYLNTKGSARTVSDFAAVHSNEGTIVKSRKSFILLYSARIKTGLRHFP